MAGEHRAHILAATAIALLAFVSCPCEAASSTTLRLPSDATGTPGGTLGVYLQWPEDPLDDRYAEGPPVVVAMHGGGQPGNLSNWAELADLGGFVVVQFVYPGGSDQGLASDGFYDTRGPLCAAAARDVWLFTLGLKQDSLGRTIHDVVGRPALTDVMGVIATSNGTMMTPVVLGTYPELFAGRVKFAAFWENIGSDQVRTVEIGRALYDCDSAFDADGNGLPDDEGKNPRYLPERDYAYESVGIDYAQVVFDAGETVTYSDPAGVFPSQQVDGIVFFDGNGNGLLDHRPIYRGCTDVDRDGLIELTEDWFVSNPIQSFSEAGALKVYYSRPLTQYLEENAAALFPNGWPAWLATLAESEAFHAARTAGDFYDHLAPYAATMRTISTFDDVPHFYVTDEFLEVQIEQEGLASSGLWRRLQPDRAYYEVWMGPAGAGYPDAPANLDVEPGAMSAYAAPGPLERNDLAIPSVLEMADRTYLGGWVDQLDATLDVSAPPAPLVEGLRFEDASTLRWDAAPGNAFYDVLRGNVSALREEGGVVELGDPLCFEEDSVDLEAALSDAPPPGEAWWVLVRPNGLGGGYGASSSGAPRDTSDACLR